jgi:hypothetical protein
LPQAASGSGARLEPGLGADSSAHRAAGPRNRDRFGIQITPQGLKPFVEVPQGQGRHVPFFDEFWLSTRTVTHTLLPGAKEGGAAIHYPALLVWHQVGPPQ